MCECLLQLVVKLYLMRKVCSKNSTATVGVSARTRTITSDKTNIVIKKTFELTTTSIYRPM